MPETILDLPIEKVYPHPMGNVRGEVTPTQIEEMALSIMLQEQIIQPLIVFTYQDGWATIDGHVRREGGKLLLATGRWPASMTQTFPCIVRDHLTYEQHRAIMLATASVRYELNPVDEGLGYQRLMVEKGLKTTREVANYCGVPESRVTSRLNIVNLAPPVVQLFRERKLKLGTAEHLIKISDVKIQTDLACTLVELGDIHLDAVAEAVSRVIRNNATPKSEKGEQIRLARQQRIIAAKITTPPPSPNGKEAAPASVDGNGANSAPIALYEGGPLGLAEIQAAVTQVCRQCAARRKLPAKVSWSAATRKWMKICDQCEAIQRISTACETCPLALFLDKLLEVEEI